MGLAGLTCILEYTYRLICQNLTIEKKDGGRLDGGPAGNAGMSMSIQEDIERDLMSERA